MDLTLLSLLSLMRGFQKTGAHYSCFTSTFALLTYCKHCLPTTFVRVMFTLMRNVCYNSWLFKMSPRINRPNYLNCSWQTLNGHEIWQCSYIFKQGVLTGNGIYVYYPELAPNCLGPPLYLAFNLTNPTKKDKEVWAAS